MNSSSVENSSSLRSKAASLQNCKCEEDISEESSSPGDEDTSSFNIVLHIVGAMEQSTFQIKEEQCEEESFQFTEHALYVKQEDCEWRSSDFKDGHFDQEVVSIKRESSEKDTACFRMDNYETVGHPKEDVSSKSDTGVKRCPAVKQEVTDLTSIVHTEHFSQQHPVYVKPEILESDELLIQEMCCRREDHEHASYASLPGKPDLPEESSSFALDTQHHENIKESIFVAKSKNSKALPYNKKPSSVEGVQNLKRIRTAIGTVGLPSDPKVHSRGNLNCCSVCGKQFSRLSSFQVHMRVHTGEKPYCCSECGKQFSSVSSLQAHKRIHTGEKPHSCPECGKQFSQLGHVQSHIRIHIGEKPYCCSACDKRFSHKSSLKTHLLIHTGEKPHCCFKCGKQFSQLSRLKAHAPVHTGQKPHCCSECGKQFSQLRSLQKHIIIHSLKKTYCCSECGKGFSSISSLKTHTRIHTGERPHWCLACGKRFSHVSSLKLHTRIHTGEKPHCCSECGKRFTQVGHLQKHMRTHTGEKPHCCSDCGKQFTHSSSLQRHMEIHRKAVQKIS
ncbi:gastrula zinc finger protein XlCGF57.1-like [Erpetoichthys calabaricus]|uniref:gastrula zinc finger protein XlCGF57.1-like n=1 Tax=Erpetoichthys calabaricus TaxID=27687 RepID=UPI00109FF247|nr:gastrula zinc finger protein XlCGF57.1-like [Erpetoichthys calabaricus]